MRHSLHALKRTVFFLIKYLYLHIMKERTLSNTEAFLKTDVSATRTIGSRLQGNKSNTNTIKNTKRETNKIHHQLVGFQYGVKCKYYKYLRINHS